MTTVKVQDMPIDPLQRAAAEAEEGPLFIIGGPGTGKTHTIVARVAMLLRGGASAHTITCLTFSGRGAEMLRQQLETSAPTASAASTIFIGTIHNYASFYIRRTGYSVLGISPHFTIWDREQAEEIIKEILEQESGPQGTTSGKDISKMLDWYEKNQRRGPEEAITAEYASWQETIDRYSQEKRRNNTLGLEDIIPLAVRAMELDPEARALWNKTRTRHLLVDEFQDITPRQYQLVNLMTGPTRSITVSADPNQSINRWSGADSSLLEQFQLDHVNRLNTRMLRVNHRGTEVLSGMASIMTQSRKMEGLNYDYQNAVRPDGERPTLNCYLGKPGEMDQHIVDWADQLMKEGYRWEDMACIYRTRRTVNRMVGKLTGRNIPYTILGNSMTDRDSNARCIMALIALALNPSDLKAFATAAGITKNSRPRQMNRELAKMIKREATRNGTNMVVAAEAYMGKLAQNAPDRRTISYIVHAWREINRMLDQKETDLHDVCRRANTLLLETQLASSSGSNQDPETYRLMSLSQTTPRMGQETLREFVARFLEMMASALEPDHQSSENGDPFAHNQGITFATIHQSKGMQWKIVWVVDADDVNMPLIRSGDPEEKIREEERVFYVSATRATHQIHFCYASADPQNNAMQASRFLTVLDEVLEKRTFISDSEPIPPGSGFQNNQEAEIKEEDPREPDPEPDFEPEMES